jgi:microcompartment protein CcmL/EutN
LLDSTDLLLWPDWNPLAREYIEVSGDAVDLEATVSTYSHEIMAFDRWVAERFIGEHLEEIESYLESERQLQERSVSSASSATLRRCDQPNRPAPARAATDPPPRWEQPPATRVNAW